MIERRVARLLEIVKWEAVQFAGQAASGKERDDEILRAVGRSGIADHPARDVIGKRAETAFEVRHLVLDDHVEAQRPAARHVHRGPVCVAISAAARLRSRPSMLRRRRISRIPPLKHPAPLAQEIVCAKFPICPFIIGDKVRQHIG